MYKLRNDIQKYDWGSPEWIPGLLGEPNPGREPMAEMWMGAHPKAPSEVLQPDGEKIGLDDLISRDPEKLLGTKTAERFENKLPFLFKVLAAGKPLSIQAHPSKTEAEEGFARENDAGIPPDDYARNYKDDNHKPELICAVTEFIAMRGFRPMEQIREEFETVFHDIDHSVYIPAFGTGKGAALDTADVKEEIRRFFESVLSLKKNELERLISHALQAVPAGELRYEWLKKLNEYYPGDVGILCPLFLNVIALQPGEAMFLPAGELHAYLHGLGIELMANSDNVLRGGCTAKNIAKDELLKVLLFDSGEPEVFRPEADARGETVYPSLAEEFRLSVIELVQGTHYEQHEVSSIEIILCTEGSCTLSIPEQDAGGIFETDRELRMEKGESAVVFADTESYILQGAGKLYKAAVR